MRPEFFTELFKKIRTRRPKSRDHFVGTLLVLSVVAILGAVACILAR